VPADRIPNPARSWSRIDGVDCLRALAILYVLLNHIHLQLLFAHVPYSARLPQSLVTALVWQGQHGVQIFFAVSGFLITATTLRRWQTPAQVRIRDFYLIRFARIAPLFLTLLAVLSLLHLAHVHYFVVSAHVGGLRSALFAALTLRIGLLEARRGYLPGSWDILWSLSVEEMFYLFFPLVRRLLGRGMGLVLVLIAFVALGPFARTVFTHGNPVWHEYSYLGGMDAIALGCLTALFLSGRQLSRRLVRTCVLCGIALLAFCLCFEPLVEKSSLEKLGLDMTIVAIGACMVIAASATSRWQVPRALHFLLAYGRRSYEIYLTHMFIVVTCFALFIRMGKPLILTPLIFIVIIALSGALGELVARFYSEPANLWLRARFGDGPATLGSVVQPAAPPGADTLESECPHPKRDDHR
jgi:peptidoglycan/LPS O-acetylase OafA/YrhL